MNTNKVLDYMVTVFAIIVLGIVGMAATVDACDEPFIVNSTAYANPAGNPTYSGRPTVDGRTLAGKTEWIGCVAALYEMNDDGTIGEFIGYREVEDTGFGVASVKVPGKGTIQTGETVDLFIENREEAIQYGERKIYIQIIDGEG